MILENGQILAYFKDAVIIIINLKILINNKIIVSYH
jgi:hypothetical protein